MLPTRRTILAALAAFPALSALRARAEEILEIEWTDLLPEGAPSPYDIPSGILPHDENAPAATQMASSEVVTKYNGKTVRIPGYVVPLDMSGVGVKEFLLVPYVGACIHVPPPPPNQLIFVTTEEPYLPDGLFEPVFVTGMIGTAAMSTQLAEIGYALSADRIEPFE